MGNKGSKKKKDCTQLLDVSDHYFFNSLNSIKNNQKLIIPFKKLRTKSSSFYPILDTHAKKSINGMQAFSRTVQKESQIKNNSHKSLKSSIHKEKPRPSVHKSFTYSILITQAKLILLNSWQQFQPQLTETRDKSSVWASTSTTQTTMARSTRKKCSKLSIPSMT